MAGDSIFISLVGTPLILAVMLYSLGKAIKTEHVPMQYFTVLGSLTLFWFSLWFSYLGVVDYFGVGPILTALETFLFVYGVIYGVIFAYFIVHVIVFFLDYFKLRHANKRRERTSTW